MATAIAATGVVGVGATFAVKVAAGDKEALQIAMDTQRRWNEFLEGATGYDAKQRSKKIQELAKKGAGAAKDVPAGL